MALKRPPPPPPTTDLVPGESPEDVHPIRLARILAEKWGDMSEGTRRVVLDELTEGGVSLPSAAPSPPAAKPHDLPPDTAQDKSPAEPSSSAIDRFLRLPQGAEDDADLKMEVMRTQMRMADGRFTSPLNLVDLLSLFSDLAGHAMSLGDMLNTVAAAWQNLTKNKRIGPSATARRPLLDHLRESLQGGEAPELHPALHDQVEAVRLLVALLIGLGQGSQAFANNVYHHLDPDKIFHELRKARGRTPTSEELWNRYKQISNSLTPREIESQLLNRIVDSVETLYHAARGG